MEPKIGIVICGFTENRQFVTNPYIPDYSASGKERPADQRICKTVRWFSLLRRRRYHPASLWRRAPERKREH